MAEENPIQPWQIKNGSGVFYEGTRSECLSHFLFRPNEMAGKDCGVELIKNPEFDWIEEAGK